MFLPCSEKEQELLVLQIWRIAPSKRMEREVIPVVLAAETAMFSAPLLVRTNPFDGELMDTTGGGDADVVVDELPLEVAVDPELVVPVGVVVVEPEVDVLPEVVVVEPELVPVEEVLVVDVVVVPVEVLVVGAATVDAPVPALLATAASPNPART
jgi:hypothetical protein